MAQHHDDAFVPATVDERIDQLASLSSEASLLPDAQVVQRLHTLYEEDLHSTERVWERLVQHVSEYDEDGSVAEYQQPGSLSETVEGKFFVQQGPLSFRKRGPTWLMLVAAVLFATLLVSSLLWVLHLTHSQPAAISVKQPVPVSPPGVYLTTPGEISRLDAQTSKVLWRTRVPAKVAMDQTMAGRPVVIGNTVYLIYGSAVLAFDASKGKFLWSSVFDTDVGDISLVNGLLYVYPLLFLSNNNKLYVVDPTNGKFKVNRAPQGGWDAPTENDVRYYVSEANPPGPTPRGLTLYALKLSNQKQLWHQQFDADQSLSNRDITVKNGIVYVSLMRLGSNKRKNSAGLIYAFNASTGKQLWKSPELPTGVRTFLVTDDNIVYCASIGDLDVFDGHTGKRLWHQHADTSDILLNAGILYINDSTMPKGPGIVALRARDGKKIWGVTSDAGKSAFPFLGLQRGIIYTIADDGKIGSIDALRASDGTRLWHLSINGDATKLGAAVA